MDPTVAASIARHSHLEQTDRFGGRVLDHLARVASAVPPEARSVAWLHDIFERTDVGPDALLGDGLTGLEEEALVLLTRGADEPYEAYTLRIAFAPGDAGRLARIVKHADLDDHMATAPAGADAPPYAWARRHIDNAQWRNHESVSGVIAA